MKVVRHWHWIPSEAVDAPSLEVFKARLDGALSNLVQWKVSLPMAGIWNSTIFKVLPKPNLSRILCIHCDLSFRRCPMWTTFSL